MELGSPEHNAQFVQLFGIMRLLITASGGSSLAIDHSPPVENVTSLVKRNTQAIVRLAAEKSRQARLRLRNGGCVGGLPCEDGNEGSASIWFYADPHKPSGLRNQIYNVRPYLM
jgi:hypothetical protein